MAAGWVNLTHIFCCWYIFILTFFFGGDRTCVFCPLGTDVEIGDSLLCTLIGGYTRRSNLPHVVTYLIPTLGSDFIIVYNRPKPVALITSSRRLLSLTLNISMKPTQTTQIVAWRPPNINTNRRLLQISDDSVACPHGFYKPYRGEGPCMMCPDGRSTSADASSIISACLCLPGYSPNPSTSTAPSANVGSCQLCPPNTYTALTRFTAQVTCLACGPNETTWGNWG